MNEELTWTAIVFAVAQIFIHLLVLATAIACFRNRQGRRKGLLAGALVVVITGLCWDAASLSPDVFRWVMSVLDEKLSWLSATGSLLFYVALLLIAMDRRSQARRIAELEAILQEREAIAKSSQATAT
jgi:hypothetical protein